jgi:excisionase family DNA binding protein
MEVTFMDIAVPRGKQLLKITEVAARLNVGRTMVYELIRTGDITPVHIGRAVRVEASAVDKLIEALAAEAEATREQARTFPWR